MLESLGHWFSFNKLEFTAMAVFTKSVAMAVFTKSVAMAIVTKPVAMTQVAKSWYFCADIKFGQVSTLGKITQGSQVSPLMGLTAIFLIRSVTAVIFIITPK